jgi:FkbM family methyltransferase
MMFQRVIGLYEVKKHKALQTFLKPGGSFIDVGANKGDFSLLAARLVGGDGKVLAFEPEPENCKWIEKSIKINGYKNIMLYEIALSDQNGEAKLFISDLSGLHSLIPDLEFRDRGAIDVKTRTLDNFLEEIGFADHFDVIKIDVEGAELQVLNGASNTLIKSNNLVLLIDIHPRLGVNPKEVCDFLVEKGVSIFHEKPPFSSPVKQYSNLTSIIARKVL